MSKKLIDNFNQTCKCSIQNLSKPDRRKDAGQEAAGLARQLGADAVN